MNIAIAPFSKINVPIPFNPKNWPFWGELVSVLKKQGHKITQFAVAGEPSFGCHEFCVNAKMDKVKEILSKMDFCICVDTWLQHACNTLGIPCIVIWSVTDPEIFGYPHHVNLIGDKECFSENQYATIDGILAGVKKQLVFVPVDSVIKALSLIGPKPAPVSDTQELDKMIADGIFIK